MSKGTGKLKNGEKININTASRDELMKLPGIGETLANAIAEARPIESAEVLDEVSGIGDATLKKYFPASGLIRESSGTIFQIVSTNLPLEG